MHKNILIAVLSLLLSACSDGNGSINGKPLGDSGDASANLSAETKPLEVLIFGGTSGIGLETTKLALARGHKVTSITRRPERMSIEHENLSNLKGDITKRDSYDALIAGKDAVISTIGLKPSRDEITVYSEGMNNVLASMAEHGVARVLTITGIGAGDSKGHGGFFYDRILNPLLLKTDYADKTRQEVLLQNSDTDWTIVRPGFLTDEASEQRYRVLQNLDGVVSGDIARADVAHFLMATIEQETYIRKTVLLSN